MYPPLQKVRQSNFELLRIIAMIIIIAHHYVVNSGLTDLYDFDHITSNMIFLQFAGFGGKMAINAFVLLSAYFMCQQSLIWGKVLKLMGEIYFYNIVIYLLFLIFGVSDISLKNIYDVITGPFSGVEKGFSGSFMAFYVLVPFLNYILPAITQKLHIKLICYLLFIYTFLATFVHNTAAWSHIWWYVTLYFIASYIRLYPNKFTASRKYAWYMLIVSIILIYASILVVDYFGSKIGYTSYYHMCIDSQKLLALTCGLSFFLLFKNIHVPQSRFINTIALTTFGVLLIHANSYDMIRFLWQDLLQNTSFYDSVWLPLHMLVSVVGVYVVCIVIDYLRIRYIERPLYAFLSKKYPLFNKKCFVD